MKRFLLIVALIVLPIGGAQALDVFACEPEWGALTRELAGDEANLTVAITAFQDPHNLQARPSLIASVRQADLVVCTGADLEIGWLPLLLRRAGNPRVQAGQPGYFLAADNVRKLEVPTRIDRAQGDIHPQGNPHVHLDPRNITRIAEALEKRLEEIDPAHAATYAARRDDFVGHWEDAIDEWELRAEPLAGMRLVSHHTSFSYLANWLDLDIVATLEPKPGIQPSGAYLAELLERLKTHPPRAVIRAPYNNEKASLWLSERLGIPALVVATTIGGNEAATDLFSLFDTIISQLEVIQP